MSLEDFRYVDEMCPGVFDEHALMSNRAEKDAVRWCHLTHQVFAGHSREHKTSLVRCANIFFEETYKP